MNQSAEPLDPLDLIHAYLAGAFPMAESRDAAEVHWYRPPVRALLPLDTSWEQAHNHRFHIRRSLARAMRRSPWELSWNQAFEKVVEGCAASVPGREETWINAAIQTAFVHLHQLGLAHSIEVWKVTPTGSRELIGGLYGLALGAAFCAESMFSRRSNASSFALVHLVSCLQASGFQLLDVQYWNDHLAQFGLYELVHGAYVERLHEAAQQLIAHPPWAERTEKVLPGRRA